MTHAAFKVQRTNSSSRCRRLWLATVWFLTAYRGWCACRIPERSLLGCLLALITFKGMVKAANTTKWKLRECYLLKTLHLKYLLENEELISAFLSSCIKYTVQRAIHIFFPSTAANQYRVAVHEALKLFGVSRGQGKGKEKVRTAEDGVSFCKAMKVKSAFKQTKKNHFVVHTCIK